MVWSFNPIAVLVASVVAAIGCTWSLTSLSYKKKITNVESSATREADKQIEQLKKDIQKEKQQTDEQRKGRTNAERELRRYVNEQQQIQRKADKDLKDSEEAAKDGYSVPPIGFIESVYRERNGCPRQGMLVPQGRGQLRLRLQLMDASHTLEGLEQYSIIWIIFIFHENTNTLRGLRKDRPSSVVKAKVSPPRLDGKKVGLFSTRTPHRPNAIGLSVARVDRIEDLIDGTPVLDIKPYIPQYDSLPDAIAPEWTYDPPAPPLRGGVVFRQEAVESLQLLVPKLRFYNKFEDIRDAIEQVLQLDIRSVRRRKQDRQRDNKEESEDEGPEEHRFAIDVLNVVFTVINDAVAVLKIEYDKELPPGWDARK